MEAATGLARPPLAALLEERLHLPGGRAVLLRPITPGDARAAQDFVGALSLDARHQRFHVGLRRLSPALLRQLTEVDPQTHVALVALQLQPATEAPRLVADARYVRSSERPGEAEFAIAVADDWQSLGLGRGLMARLAAHARQAGLRALFGDVLVQNRRMLVLMQGLGARLRPHPDGPQLARAVFDLAALGETPAAAVQDPTLADLAGPAGARRRPIG
ncbi:MAG: GNAT family N-acetyltransferase [Burkholderiaceae bacterium]